MLNIDLSNPSDSSTVLVSLFLDAMGKFGKKKKIKSMGYSADEGLVIVDENDVVWSMEVNAKVLFPKELNNKINSRVEDKFAEAFCVNCDRGIKEDLSYCSVCEYLQKV